MRVVGSSKSAAGVVEMRRVPPLLLVVAENLKGHHHHRHRRQLRPTVLQLGGQVVQVDPLGLTSGSHFAAYGFSGCQVQE